jgi:F-type H+-transporting ATPase subunit b
MLIDWFTVGAQIINFIVLVWLLKRFLYKPILNAIDTREKKIATELTDADAKKVQAQKESDDFKAKNAAFDNERVALMGKVEQDAKAERDRLFSEARKDADGLRIIQATALQNDRTRLEGEIRRLAVGETFEIARKALADLATVSLEERMGEVFTRRLRELDPKSKETLGAALRSSSEPALVRSAFDLGQMQRSAIQSALNEDFSAEIRLRFEIAPEIICGIELTTNGQKVGWSVAGYLVSLEQKFDSLVYVVPSATDPAVNAIPAEKAPVKRVA